MLLKYGANMNWSPPSGSITAGLSQCGITGTALQVAAVSGWNQIGKKKKKKKKKNKATKQQRRKNNLDLITNKKKLFQNLLFFFCYYISDIFISLFFFFCFFSFFTVRTLVIDYGAIYKMNLLQLIHEQVSQTEIGVRMLVRQNKMNSQPNVAVQSTATYQGDALIGTFENRKVENVENVVNCVTRL